MKPIFYRIKPTQGKTWREGFILKEENGLVKISPSDSIVDELHSSNWWSKKDLEIKDRKARK